MSALLSSDGTITAMLAEAAARLKAAGFQVVNVSMRSEAVYYALPGYRGLLRLAAHRSNPLRQDLRTDRPTVARVTLSPFVKPQGLDGILWQQVGRYVLWHDAPEKRLVQIGGGRR
jgi:hypothetical protein